MIHRNALYSRSEKLVPPRTRELVACVAGCGMVGSWATLALARMCDEVHIWDFDLVEMDNIGVQAYGENHIGIEKARATAQMCNGLNVVMHATRFEELPRQLDAHNVVLLSAVDTMSGRRQVAEEAKRRGVPLFIDTRVTGEIAHIRPVQGDDELQLYLDCLPSDDDLPEPACGAKGTSFIGMWVASQVAAVVNNFGRGLPRPEPLTWHVGLNTELTAA